MLNSFLFEKKNYSICFCCCLSCEMGAIVTFEKMFIFWICLGENVMMIGDNE